MSPPPFPWNIIGSRRTNHNGAPRTSRPVLCFFFLGNLSFFFVLFFSSLSLSLSLYLSVSVENNNKKKKRGVVIVSSAAKVDRVDDSNNSCNNNNNNNNNNSSNQNEFRHSAVVVLHYYFLFVCQASVLDGRPIDSIVWGNERHGQDIFKEYSWNIGSGSFVVPFSGGIFCASFLIDRPVDSFNFKVSSRCATEKKHAKKTNTTKTR